MSRVLIEARMRPPGMVEVPSASGTLTVTDSVVLRYEGSAEFNEWAEEKRMPIIEDWCNEHLKPLLDALNPTCNTPLVKTSHALAT